MNSPKDKAARVFGQQLCNPRAVEQAVYAGNPLEQIFFFFG
jgi:hypothetical protein